MKSVENVPELSHLKIFCEHYKSNKRSCQWGNETGGYFFGNRFLDKKQYNYYNKFVIAFIT